MNLLGVYSLLRLHNVLLRRIDWSHWCLSIDFHEWLSAGRWGISYTYLLLARSMACCSLYFHGTCWTLGYRLLSRLALKPGLPDRCADKYHHNAATRCFRASVGNPDGELKWDIRTASVHRLIRREELARVSMVSPPLFSSSSIRSPRSGSV